MSTLLRSLGLAGAWRPAPLAGVEERVEERLGEALEARDDQVALVAREGGLGPPDLVWLCKLPEDGHCEPQGCAVAGRRDASGGAPQPGRAAPRPSHPLAPPVPGAGTGPSGWTCRRLRV